MQRIQIKHTGPISSVADLCDFNDWTNHPFWRYVYYPFGILIILYRLVVLLFGSLLLLPFGRNFKCRAFKLILGIIGIRVSANMSLRQVETHTKGAVVAVNHVSAFDFFFSLVQPKATIIVVHTAGLASRLLGFFLLKGSGTQYWTVKNVKQLAQHFSKWRQNPETTALYVTPEGTINNGEGLFQFKPDFLSRGFPVVPLAVKIKTPFGISPHPMFESGAMRFIRLFMMPWISFDLAYLEKQIRKKGQSKVAFAASIQQAIANELEIPATNWTPEEKHDLIKSLKTPNC